MAIRTRSYRYDFRGHLNYPEVANAAGEPFVVTDTSAAGTPVMGGIDAGGYRLGFDAAAEVQNLRLSMGDVLPFNMGEVIRAEFLVRTTALLDPATSIAFGLASALNDDPDVIAAAAMFRCVGDNSLVIETDDGVNDLDDRPTGFVLGSAWRRYAIDFASAVSTFEPPTLSKGRGSNIGFYASNEHGSLRRVASNTRFDMSAYSGGLQPFVQIQKTADANEDFVDVLEIEVEVNQAA